MFPFHTPFPIGKYPLHQVKFSFSLSHSFYLSLSPDISTFLFLNVFFGGHLSSVTINEFLGKRGQSSFCLCLYPVFLQLQSHREQQRLTFDLLYNCNGVPPIFESLSRAGPSLTPWKVNISAQTASALHPQTLSTILPSTGQNKHYGNILL